MRLRQVWNYVLIFSPLLLLVMAMVLLGLGIWLSLFRSSLWSVLPMTLSVALLGLMSLVASWSAPLRRGNTAVQKGLLDEAARQFEDARRKTERFGANDPRRPIVWYSLADVYRLQARFVDAEALMREALIMNERIWGPDHQQTLQSVVGLANVLMAVARFQDAENLLNRALTTTLKRKGPNSVDAAVCLNNLGKICSDQRRFADAECYFRRMLPIAERSWLTEIRVMAPNNTAWACCHQGKLDESEPLARQALALAEKKLGSQHLLTSHVANTLAQVLCARKEYAAALALARRALETRETYLDPDHPSIAGSLSCLGKIHEGLGNNAEAESLFRRALAINEATLVPEHPDLAESRNNYVRLLRRAGRGDYADSLEQSAGARPSLQ